MGRKTRLVGIVLTITIIYGAVRYARSGYDGSTDTKSDAPVTVESESSHD